MRSFEILGYIYEASAYLGMLGASHLIDSIRSNKRKIEYALDMSRRVVSGILQVWNRM